MGPVPVKALLLLTGDYYDAPAGLGDCTTLGSALTNAGYRAIMDKSDIDGGDPGCGAAEDILLKGWDK